MAEFYVGQKVVCVDVREHPEWLSSKITYVGGLDGLERGRIYTIRAIAMATPENILELKIAEIIRPTMQCHDPDPGYAAERFRPLVSQSKGMELIRAIVANPSKPIPAEPREPALTPNEIASIPGGLL